MPPSNTVDAEEFSGIAAMNAANGFSLNEGLIAFKRGCGTITSGSARLLANLHKTTIAASHGFNDNWMR